MLIKIFQTKSGKEPFIHWLEKIKDKNAQTRIRQRIRRLEENNFGDFKPLGKNLYELRLDFGPGYRVYCAKGKENSEEIIFLLLGGSKGTQEKDILKSRKIYND
ncbi:MAG: type II toxin-antitoxin system RelE/ParE family toxin [bacterium]